MSHGVRIGIRVSEPSVLERVSALLPPGSVPSPSSVVSNLYSLVVGSTGPRPGVRRYHLLYAGSMRLARLLDLGKVLDVLDEHLHALLATRAPRRLFVHGGVVGWQGRAIVVLDDHSPGVMTTVGALVRAGATYYSTRYAVLDARGRVHAYPTPLVDERPSDACGHGPSREAAEGEKGRRSLPLGLIVCPGDGPEARGGFVELSPAQAVLALLRHTAASRLRPAFALRTLRCSVSGATAVRIAREASSDVVGRLLDRLDPVPPVMRG